MKKSGGLKLEVTDNGMRLPDGQAASKGIGLRTVRDRVKLPNGTLNFARVPGGGVRVTIHISLPEAQQQS